MAKDAGATFVLVGHSERRHVFGETDAQTAKKCAAAVRNGLVPMLCVGELLERARGRNDARRLFASTARRDSASCPMTQVAAMAIAYEPVWAIGTGKTATPADASDVHADDSGSAGEAAWRAGCEVPILYGGSVNAGNAGVLLAAENVDGLLVGGASLESARTGRRSARLDGTR